MSAFVISKRANGHYKFIFASRKGKTIFTSIACRQKSDCKLIIAALQDEPLSFKFSQSRTGSGKFFFRVSRGGLVLATSRKFSTQLMLQKGIDQFKNYVEVAETFDFPETEDVFGEVEAE